jgi:hypothetical protein
LCVPFARPGEYIFFLSAVQRTIHNRRASSFSPSNEDAKAEDAILDAALVSSFGLAPF